MNQLSASELFKAVRSCQGAGIGQWKECIFSGDLQSDDSTASDLKSTALKRLDRLFRESVDDKIRTFVRRKVYRRMSSIADDMTQNFYGGQPLQLEDHVGDISFAELSRNYSPGIDQSYLVTETNLQEILSHLWCSFTSESGIVNPTDTLQRSLPMLIFYKTTKHSQDRNGISLVTGLEVSGKLKGLLERRLTVRGPYPSTTWCVDSTPNSSPNHPSQSSNSNLAKFHQKCLQNLAKQHLGPARLDRKVSVSMESYAEYELLESNKPLLDNPDQDMSLTYATVSVKCSQVHKILQDDIQHITSVNLKVTPLPGDMRSSAFSLYKNIQILEGLFSAFGESGEVKWTSVDDEVADENSTPQSKPTTYERIREIIASYGVEWMVLQRERKKAIANEEKQDKNETSNEQVTAAKPMIFPREELDFTERIWEVLKYVSSCLELVDSFKLILKEITDRKAMQFWLHRNNNTTLAKLIRKSYVGDVTTKIELTNANCIMLLIEIGLDKLGRDYHNFFISNHLASSGRLSEYFTCDETEHKLGQSLVSALQQRFIMMKKLHHITELIVQCKLFLCLSDEQIFSITKTALHTYISKELDFSKTFEFPIEYSEIETLVSDRLPSVWTVILKSVENNAEKVSSHCWMTEYPFKGIISQSKNEEEKTPNYRGMSTGSAFDTTPEYYIASQASFPYTF